MLHKLTHSWYWTESTFPIICSLANAICQHNKRFPKKPRKIFLCPNYKSNFMCLAITFRLPEMGVASYMWDPWLLPFLLVNFLLWIQPPPSSYTSRSGLFYWCSSECNYNSDCSGLFFFKGDPFGNMSERVKLLKNIIGHVNFFDQENRLNLSVIK